MEEEAILYSWKELLGGNFNSERMLNLINSLTFVDLKSGRLVSVDGMETYPEKDNLKLFSEVTTKDLIELVDLLSTKHWEFLTRNRVKMDLSPSAMTINLRDLEKLEDKQ